MPTTEETNAAEQISRMDILDTKGTEYFGLPESIPQTNDSFLILEENEGFAAAANLGDGKLGLYRDARTGKASLVAEQSSGQEKWMLHRTREGKSYRPKEVDRIKVNETTETGLTDILYGDLIGIKTPTGSEVWYAITPDRLVGNRALGFKIVSLNIDAQVLLDANVSDPNFLKALYQNPQTGIKIENIDSNAPQIHKTPQKIEQKEAEISSPKWGRGELDEYKIIGGPAVITLEDGYYMAHSSFSDFQFPDLDGLKMGFEVRERKVRAYTEERNSQNVVSAKEGVIGQSLVEIKALDVVLLGGRFAYIMTKDIQGRYPPRLFAIPPSFFADIEDIDPTIKAQKISERFLKGGKDISSLIDLVGSLKELGEVAPPKSST